MPTITLSVTRLDAPLGARVDDAHLADGLDDATAHALRTTLADHKVVVVPGQHLGPDQLAAVALAFGPDASADTGPTAGNRAADRAGPTASGAIGSSTIGTGGEWLIDRSFLAAPPATLLAAFTGAAQAEFADLQAAHDALSAPLRRLVSGLDGEHAGGPAGVVGRHPLVRVDPDSGRRSLFVSPGTTTRIAGLPDPESESLLALLALAATAPGRTLRHQVAPGDLVIWDNRAVAHRGIPAPVSTSTSNPAPGTVHRLAVADPRPVAPSRRPSVHPFQY
jgi:alpha-ketoglutarate-dependent taurine dioxygenase